MSIIKNDVLPEEEWITADIPMDEENDYRDVEWSDLAIPEEDLNLD